MEWKTRMHLIWDGGSWLVRQGEGGIAFSVGSLRVERAYDKTPGRLVIELYEGALDEVARMLNVAPVEPPPPGETLKVLKNIEDLLTPRTTAMHHGQFFEVRATPEQVSIRAKAGDCYGCGKADAAPLCPDCQAR